MYFWPAALGKLCPFARSVGLRREVLGEHLVLRDGDAFYLLGPLMLANDAVEAPMDEHAEFSLVPPVHALGAGCGLSCVGGRGLGRGWLGLRGGG